MQLYDIDTHPLVIDSPHAPRYDTCLSSQKNCWSVTDNDLCSLIFSHETSNVDSCEDSMSLFSDSNTFPDEKEYTPISQDIFNTQKQNIQVFNSFLKPGSMFTGHQESGRHQYKVEVKLLNVDMHNTSISGLLTIHHLTETHPVLTTYFDGEIIGKKHSFVTKSKEYESSVRNDIQHWARFTSWRDLNLDLREDGKNEHWYQNQAHLSDHIYMRWKEKFIYPDSNVSNIKGASFAGFYYVCLNVRTGSITGLYFHKFTDRFQQLDLSHVPDMGVCQTFELC